MANVEVASYDVSKVTVAVNGRIITGFASEGVVTLTHNEDRVSTEPGCKGEITYSENANESGAAALTLMSTSSSLPYLRQLCASRQMIRLTVSDASDATEIHVNEENCRITKMPDTARGKAAGSVTVNIFIPSLSYR